MNLPQRTDSLLTRSSLLTHQVWALLPLLPSPPFMTLKRRDTTRSSIWKRRALQISAICGPRAESQGHAPIQALHDHLSHSRQSLIRGWPDCASSISSQTALHHGRVWPDSQFFMELHTATGMQGQSTR